MKKSDYKGVICVIHKWEVTLPELTGDAPRRAYVYVPDGARHGERFPVLYMFDGHNVFFDSDATYGKSWGMKEFLENNGVPLIVAAVECCHGANGERLSEYSPFDFRAREFGELSGRGRETMEWYVNVFKPYVDSHYPTLPDREHTFIAGSSMGGLMSLYAVTEYNGVFSKAAALSPSVMIAAAKLDELLQTAPIAPGTTVYMDYGSQELRHLPEMRLAKRFGKVASILISRGVFVTARVVPGGRHCEASWEKQIPFFMDALFYGE